MSPAGTKPNTPDPIQNPYSYLCNHLSISSLRLERAVSEYRSLWGNNPMATDAVRTLPGLRKARTLRLLFQTHQQARNPLVLQSC